MTMTALPCLYGSLTSPYVRRIRIWFAEHHIPYDYVNLNIFSPDDKNILTRLNPTHKIPMLAFQQDVIFDSSVIQRYLSNKYHRNKLNWQQENQLTVINSANDSLVELLLCQRSGLDTNEDLLFFNLQHQRISSVLKHLDNEFKNNPITDFDYVAICLFCLIDWILFRQLVSMQPYLELMAFHTKHKQRTSCKATIPSD